MVPTPQYIQYLSKVSAFATSKTHKWPKATRKAAANANTFSEEETVVPLCQYLGGENCGTILPISWWRKLWWGLQKGEGKEWCKWSVWRKGRVWGFCSRNSQLDNVYHYTRVGWEKEGCKEGRVCGHWLHSMCWLYLILAGETLPGREEGTREGNWQEFYVAREWSTVIYTCTCTHSCIQHRWNLGYWYSCLQPSICTVYSCCYKMKCFSSNCNKTWTTHTCKSWMVVCTCACNICPPGTIQWFCPKKVTFSGWHFFKLVIMYCTQLNALRRQSTHIH